MDVPYYPEADRHHFVYVVIDPDCKGEPYPILEIWTNQLAAVMSVEFKRRTRPNLELWLWEPVGGQRHARIYPGE